MTSKNAIAISLSFSALCLFLAPSAKAAGITIGTDYFMTVSKYTSGEKNYQGYSVGTTLITIYSDIGGVKGASVATFDGFCIDFQDSISTPTTYEVVAQGVGSNYSTSVYNSLLADGAALSDPTDLILEKDAALGSQFGASAASDANLQDTIWNYSGASYTGSGVTTDTTYANNNYGAYSGNADAIAFLEVPQASTDWRGKTTYSPDGQSFMEVGTGVPQTPPPPATPEPSSLILLGTGLVGMAGAMRRKLVKA